MLIRALDYLETRGVYHRKAEVPCAIRHTGPLSHMTFDLQRVLFDVSKGRIVLHPEDQERWQVRSVDHTHLLLTFDLTPGYYVLIAKCEGSRSAMSVVVCDRDQTADIAVIRPVFTQWSYHWAGFYFNEERPLVDRVLGMIEGLGPIGRATARTVRQYGHRLSLQGITFPYKPFPAHPTINLGDFYRRNNRWNRTMWDTQLGCLEGLWNDELLSGMPIFALLDKNRVPYHVLTDVDVHNMSTALEQYRVLVFSGQEGMTPSYYQMLRRLQTTGKTAFLVWGVQGFGYRQLDYDATTGQLTYVCTRGRHGMWGDQLEERQPDWEDEAQIFGFHFPEPQSANWRYETLYSRIKIVQPDHPIVGASSSSDQAHHYEVRDLEGNGHPGLTWAGGEIQQRARPDALVIAHLDEHTEVIGIGEYRNTVLFAPTYLPAFFAYQACAHPEVEQWFMAALHYLLNKCASA